MTHGCSIDRLQYGEPQFEIRFLYRDCVKSNEIYRRLTVQYGDNCMRQRKVSEWMERFKERRKIVHDERSGRP